MYRRFFSENMRQILTVSIVVQCLCVFVFFYSYAGLQKVAKDNITQFADRYVEKVAEQLNRNNTYMGQTTVLTKDYRTMFQQEDMVFVNKVSELQVTYKLLSELSEIQYHFFAYDKGDGKYVELTAVRLPFSEYRLIRPGMIAQAGSSPVNGKWYLLDTEGGRIITAMWTYDDFVLGAWIEEASLLSGMSMLDCGPNGGISLLRKEAESSPAGGRQHFGTSIIRYDLEECDTDFSIQVVIANNRRMNQIMVMQLVQFILALQIMLILVMLIWQVRQNLIIPVKNLMEVLNKYQSVIPEAGRKEQKAGQQEGINAAVDDAYMILDKLGSRVETLTVELYESELEKKQLQINFRNLQIRPHFFVNCLAMISGMAQVNAVDKIQQMTVCLSKYYRYVLHDCMDMVPLYQELVHMENVIRVNAEWSSNELSFDYEVEEAVKELLIPVLCVSTFLENSIKHADGTDKALDIHLIAKAVIQEKEAYLYLRITDNGRGFPDEMVQGLNSGAAVRETDGRHIGINNVLQRLKLIYGGRARVLFSKGEKGGACVEIWIPEEME